MKDLLELGEALMLQGVKLESGAEDMDTYWLKATLPDGSTWSGYLPVADITPARLAELFDDLTA